MNVKYFMCWSIIACSINIQASTYLLFGGYGWIGKKIALLLEKQNHVVYCSSCRLENREAIEQEIERLKPDFIINTAGITGKPTIDWCESHKQDTIRSNVLGLINLVDVAFLHNIHVTNVATGCIYQYDDVHPLRSGIGFSECDEPNFSGSFYSLTKIAVEKIILNYPNVLNLRLRMPISSDLDPKSFIGKIIRYTYIIDMPNSMSILDDLLPLVPLMCDRRLTGNYNFVNPGTISHKEILDLYKEYVNPHHTCTYISFDQQSELLKVPRSNCQLSAYKLCKEFPHIPSIKESIVTVFKKISRNTTTLDML